MVNDKLKLLIVESEQSVLHQIKESLVKLELLEFDSATAHSLAEAVEKIKADSYNAVLLDLALPDSKGLDTLKKLLSISKEIAIVATDSEGSVENGRDAVKMGAQDFIERDKFDRVLLDRTLGYAIIRQLFVNKLNLFNRTKDEFLSIVSHDLRSPLSFIRSSMQLLLGENERIDPVEMKDLLERANGLAGYALDLINDLLDLGKIEHGIELHYENFVIKDLVSTCVNYFRIGLSDKNLSLTTEYENENFEIFADPARISQTINNILGNAIKFTPKGGRIHIAVSAFKGRRIMDTKSRILKIAISDNGPGIPKDKLEKIFDKYEQARHKDAKTGTGLGLAICKQIIKLHKGNIWVESEEGKGSSFSVFLPNLVEKRVATEGAKKKFCVYIVDDFDDVRIATKSQLERLGFEVPDFSNGRLALEQLKKRPPDLLITDLDMPVMGGLNLIQAIRASEEIKTLPIIVYTSKSNQFELDRFNRIVHDFIFKPASTIELEFKVKNALNIPTDVISSRKFNSALPTVIFTHNGDPKRTELIESLLSRVECNILDPKNGVEAQFLFGKHTVDLMIVDLNLPLMAGIDLLQAIRKKSNVPAALILPKGESLSSTIRISAGIDYVVEEPGTLEKWQDIIARTLRLKPYADEGKAGLKILLVDDAEDNRVLVKTFLKGLPHVIEEAESGEEALEKFKSGKFDLVIMDIVMSGMDGHTATRAIRQWEHENSKERIPVIAFTAHESPEEKAKCRESGCNECLTKPVSKTGLLEMIRRFG